MPGELQDALNRACVMRGEQYLIYRNASTSISKIHGPGIAVLTHYLAATYGLWLSVISSGNPKIGPFLFPRNRFISRKVTCARTSILVGGVDHFVDGGGASERE